MDLQQKIALVLEHGLQAGDARAWWMRFYTHGKNAKFRDVETKLSFSDYLLKASLAGLKSPKQIGTRTGYYVLTRHTQTGPYNVDTCAFVLASVHSVALYINGRHRRRVAVMVGRTKATSPGIASQADAVAREFVLIAPDGTRHEGKNVLEFAQARGLCPQSLYPVLNGKRKSHRGWRGAPVVTTNSAPQH